MKSESRIYVFKEKEKGIENQKQKKKYERKSFKTIIIKEKKTRKPIFITFKTTF